MEKRSKKLAALLLGTVMCISVAGCGGQKGTPDAGGGAETPQSTESKAPAESAQAAETAAEGEELYYNKEGFPIVKEPITIEVAGVQGPTKDWGNTYFVKKVEEMMGIKMNCTTYADAATWQTQYATMLASDSLPDLMMQLNVSKVSTNMDGADGYLLDFSDYLDVMPNLAKYLESHPEYAAYHTTSDGSIYSLDKVNEVGPRWYSLFVSKADEEKYGFSVDEIKTTEDFYNVLKSIKEQDPDVIPLSLTIGGESGQRGILTIRNAFGLTGVENTLVMSVDGQGQVNLDNLSDKYRAFLTYMNRLWEEELLDHETFIQTTDEFESKIADGKVVFWHSWTGINLVMGSNYGIYKDYDGLCAMTSEYQDEPIYTDQTPYTAAARVMVSAKTKYPEAICRLIDYVFTDEGRRFVLSGVEGETFDYVTDERGFQSVSYDGYWDQSKYASAQEWETQEVRIVNALDLWSVDASREFVEGLSDGELEALLDEGPDNGCMYSGFYENMIRKQVDKEIYASYQPLPLSLEEADEISQPQTDMELLIRQFRAQFIAGEKDIDTEWDSYVRQISSFWEQIQPIYQAAQDRAAASR